MGVIAWVVPGLAAGLTARMVTPGRISRGRAVSWLPGIAGALPGSHPAILLPACHLVTGRLGRRGYR
jgi:uncharacterized membrane protein YeaQ/YmgE (transglycosylase-associated protein family)